MTAQNRWWLRLNDPVSEQLVAETLAGNTDLQGAAARVLRAQALLDAAQGRRLPQVLGTARAAHQQISLDGSGFSAVGPGGSSGDPDTIEFETYEVGIDVSWQLDLWGKLRRAEDAAIARVLASEAERLALAHTLVAEAVRGRATVAILRQRVALARANAKNRSETLGIVERRYEEGLTPATDVRLARENMALAEGEVHRLGEQVALAIHALDTLRGLRPATGEPLPPSLPPLPGIEPPPAGLPAGLLDRRPDLIASELRARADVSDIGVRVADLFPDLTLTGGAGLSSGELDTLLDSGSFVYDLILNAVQPIFTAGVEQAQVRAAEASAQEAASAYAGAVLGAMREVEDALVRERSTRAQLASAQAGLAEAVAAESLALDRYMRGVGDLLRVFEADRRRRAGEERVAMLRQSLWNARIDLHLALGGDWALPELIEPARVPSLSSAQIKAPEALEER